MQPETVTDTRTIDRQIAERLGWRFEYPEYMAAGGYKLFDLHGMEQGHQTSWGWTTTFLKDEYKKVVPRYDTDLNAAMSLVRAAQPCYFELSYSPDRMNWRAEFTPLSRMDRIEFADARTPAEAICLAYLAYTAAPRPGDGDPAGGG